MTEVRWIFEKRKMSAVFPEFEPVWKARYLGFQGALCGRNGKTYVVTIQARVRNYPSEAPKIFILPIVGGNWLSDGSLCVERPWVPEQSNFAQQVNYAASYIAKHG